MAREQSASQNMGAGQSDMLPSNRLLVVIAKREAAMHATAAGVMSATGADTGRLNQMLSQTGGSMHPLFGESEERVRAKTMAAPSVDGRAELPEMDLYYYVEAPDEQLDTLASQLKDLPTVAGAYVTPAPQPARVMERPTATFVEEINAQMPRPEEAPPATPDFTPRQLYLGPATAGIDAQYAWTVAGGRGAGVQIMDCERGVALHA